MFDGLRLTRTAPESVYLLPVQSRSLQMAEYQRRARSVAELGDRLPQVDMSTLATHMDAMTAALPEDVAVSIEMRCAVASLAVYGWEGQQLHGQPVLRCASCHQTVGLWGFRTILSTAEGDAMASHTMSGDGEDESAATLQVFDPAAEHRWYCPWVSDYAGQAAKTASNFSFGIVNGDLSCTTHRVKAGWQHTLELFESPSTVTPHSASANVGSADSSGSAGSSSKSVGH
ncbi:hypothetical protein THASP1DRAFT_28836 [Thamnocephalis sphaerospora]|uniref:NuBaID C-terminal domain-containing protein n=1 Tax=Thamnocephalis sphaerospora TaxID=78915 RepID=A0A4P9XUV3_9FUNG|nr:hypothetical protein THASP1DRAFT_28836 [Thamnocephalis sphaerospora]|eukprot:RKP09361.1 hypothetical protein THASP1DRAFT_28836 [Thamnocephalis sphaerospora]